MGSPWVLGKKLTRSCDIHDSPRDIHTKGIHRKILLGKSFKPTKIMIP